MHLLMHDEATLTEAVELPDLGAVHSDHDWSSRAYPQHPREHDIENACTSTEITRRCR